jgi:ketosteroid isomerase-like protein
MATLTAQIQATEDAYATAWLARNADGVVAYYADDVVSYAKEKEPVRGKEAMRQRLAEGIAKDTTGNTPSFKVLELFVGPDHITEIGSWTDTGKDGQVKDHGTYFSVFKKKGDKWECVRDISVSHTPKKEDSAPAPAP